MRMGAPNGRAQAPGSWGESPFILSSLASSLATPPCSPDPDGPAAIPGIPVGAGASQRVIEELGMDDCVLSAQALLESQMDSYWKGSESWRPVMVNAPAVRFAGL
jgi:hypothetical protein